jgi:hypothetical protein
MAVEAATQARAALAEMSVGAQLQKQKSPVRSPTGRDQISQLVGVGMVIEQFKSEVCIHLTLLM